MQMGPALLPTPLSPARGLPSLSHPKARLFRKRLAPDVFPRARKPAFCHRRSRRHPASACGLPCSLWAEAFRLHGIPWGSAETVGLYCLLSQTAASGFTLLPPRSLTKPSVLPLTSLRTPLKQADLLPVETFDMPPLRKCVDKCHRTFGTSKPLNFSALWLDLQCLLVPKTS